MRMLIISVTLSFLAAVAPGQTGLQYLDFGPNGKVTASTSDANGNVYVSGNAEDFQGSPGLNTIRVYKLFPSGSIAYSFDFQPGNTSLHDAGTVTALTVDSSANVFAAQFIFVGSQDITNLGRYFSSAPNMQVRYVDHGKDEVGTWKCGQ